MGVVLSRLLTSAITITSGMCVHVCFCVYMYIDVTVCSKLVSVLMSCKGCDASLGMETK